jgi:lipopolysaccharide/colanic/teichoic acid biosynthesis glycosyltransferase
MQYIEVKKGSFYEVTKRMLDLVLAVILLITFFPIIVIVAILIKMDSPGPVFADTPRRVGKNGKLFKMYKFRSMIQNAHELLRSDPEFEKLFREYKNSRNNKKNIHKLKKMYELYYR